MRPHSDLIGFLAALLLFGSAFGFIEAAVVVDLRAIHEPLQRQHHPTTPAGELFPLLTLEELDALPSPIPRLLRVEIARELATLILLAGFGLAVGGSPLRRFGAFVAAFGVWDLSYYAFLLVLEGWPMSLLTWDLLFLIPVPWTAPVLAPTLVAVVMVLCGSHTVARDLRADPIRPRPTHWLGLSLGGVLVLAAFLANAAGAMASGVPERFPWGIFALGLGLALTTYVHASYRNASRS